MPTTNKARVLISLREDVLDVQGQTIQAAVKELGYDNIKNMRVGKFIEIELNDPIDSTQIKQIEDISNDILANPVIEDYKVELL